MEYYTTMTNTYILGALLLIAFIMLGMWITKNDKK